MVIKMNSQEDNVLCLFQVKFPVFLAYCRSLGGFNAPVLLMFYVAYQTSMIASNIWLSQWTEDPILKNATIFPNSSVYLHTRDKYLGVYGGLGSSQGKFHNLIFIN